MTCDVKFIYDNMRVQGLLEDHENLWSVYVDRVRTEAHYSLLLTTHYFWNAVKWSLVYKYDVIFPEYTSELLQAVNNL